jgi:hypothetical protein
MERLSILLSLEAAAAVTALEAVEVLAVSVPARYPSRLAQRPSRSGPVEQARLHTVFKAPMVQTASSIASLQLAVAEAVLKALLHKRAVLAVLAAAVLEMQPVPARQALQGKVMQAATAVVGEVGLAVAAVVQTQQGVMAFPAPAVALVALVAMAPHHQYLAQVSLMLVAVVALGRLGTGALAVPEAVALVPVPLEELELVALQILAVEVVAR